MHDCVEFLGDSVTVRTKTRGNVHSVGSTTASQSLMDDNRERRIGGAREADGRLESEHESDYEWVVRGGG